MGGAPAKNGQFDASVKVGARERSWIVRRLEFLWQRCEHAQSPLFENLDLPFVEQAFRDASGALDYTVVPHLLRRAGPSHEGALRRAAGCQFKGTLQATPKTVFCA